MVVAIRRNVRCTVVGDGLTGKSCLVHSFIDGEFNTEYIATLKDAYESYMRVNGENYQLHINDIAGEHEDLSYFEVPDVYIVCFSLVDRDSMESVQNFWIPRIRAVSKHVPIVLIGTQMDMRKVDKKGHISNTEGLTLSKTIAADSYVECSAKFGTGVQESFFSAVTASIKNNKRKMNIIKRVLGR